MAARPGSLPARVNPMTTAVLVGVATLIGLLSGPWYLAAFAGLVLVAVTLAGRLRSFLAVFAAALLPAGALMFVLQFFATPGEPVLVEWWVLRGTRPGLDNAIRFVTRLWVIGIGVLAAAQLIDLRTFSRDLEQRGVSARVTYVMQSTFLIIPELQKRAAVILDAQRARGIETDANLAVRLKALIPAAAPLILSSVTGVQERAVALEARGMTLEGPRTSTLQVPDSGADKAVRVAALLGLVAVIGWRVWAWTR